MKYTYLYALLAAMALAAASCSKDKAEPIATAVTTHNPLYGTVWEAAWYETPGGEFDSYTERLLFKTDTTGEIVSIKSVVYYSGSNPGYTQDTTVAMAYRLDTMNHELYIHSDYAGNPSRLTYNLNEETMTVVGDAQKVYIRVM